MYKKINKNNINYGDTGFLWIDKPINNFFVNNGIIKDDEGIKSDNASFDTSSLNEITFIEGHIELDKLK